MAPVVTIQELTHGEANTLWQCIVADLDLYACFGRDTDHFVIGGEWWGALQQDGVTIGVIWLSPWIEGDESVITVSRALLPEHRNQKNSTYHRDAICAKLKEVYPNIKTSIALVYSTNPASMKAMLNRKGARIAGAIPFGNDTTLYLFVLDEWK